MIKPLLEKVQAIEDENGEKQEMVSLGGLYVDAKFLRVYIRNIRNTKKWPLRDDDILLVSFPKTGNVLLCIYILGLVLFHLLYHDKTL